MKDLSFVPVYVVFGVLGFLGFLAAVLVLYAHCFSSKRKNCCMLGQHDDQVRQAHFRTVHLSAYIENICLCNVQLMFRTHRVYGIV